VRAQSCAASIVQAGENSLLKIASRRRAAKLITDATELLEARPVLQVSGAPSTGCDPGVRSDPQRSQ
jgi:hypothetical protein